MTENSQDEAAQDDRLRVKRPRRSALYMPASNARALEKAQILDADTLIFDLEDAVAPEQKAAARTALAAALSAHDYAHKETVLRINGRGTPWFDDDLRFAAQLPVDALLVPKINDAQDVATLSPIISSMGKALWVMIETPLSLLNLAAIAHSAQTSPLATLILGGNDLAKEMRFAPDIHRTAFQPIMTQMVAAARSYGLTALDGVCNAIGDADQLEAECQQGRLFGFDGKTLIHPAQIDTANRVFAPTQAALDEARAIIAAFDDPHNRKAGVLRVQGKMVERLHLEQAQQLVRDADMIASTKK